MDRSYFSIRSGKRPDRVEMGSGILGRQVVALYSDFEAKHYFQEALGYHCIDRGFVPETMGTDIEAYAFRKLKSWGLFPPKAGLKYADEDLFDHVSKPLTGWHHDYDNCGWHYDTFDKKAGQDEFKKDANEFLAWYGQGWEMSSEGLILLKAKTGLEDLLDAELPPVCQRNVDGRVKAAILKFRRYPSTADNKKDAVRDLADVLEFLRPQAKTLLAYDDERDLFDLANNYGIRHHRQGQKTYYDRDVWFPWAFHYYLATIHALVRLIKDRGPGGNL